MESSFRFLLTNDVARRLDVSPATVHYYERTGRLNAARTEGGVRLFRLEEVERLAASRKEFQQERLNRKTS